MKGLSLLTTVCLFVSTSLLTAADKISVDILVINAYVLTMDTNFTVFQQGAIAISSDTIRAVGNQQDLQKQYTARETIDAAGQLVMPGLINTHTHAAMTLLRGISDDVPLEVWLKDYIWPAETAIMDRKAVKTGTELALVEMIRSGTTTFNDGYFFVDQVAEAAAQAGVRAFVSESVADFPMPGARDEAAYFETVKQLMNQWGGHPLITVVLGPHATYTCSPELLEHLHAFGQKHKLSTHLHLSETPTEVATIQARYGATPVQHMANHGLLYEGLIAAHGVVLTDSDIQLLKRFGVGVSHNPESNMKLGSGIAPLRKLLDAGVDVGLGTDGAASNNNLDMMEEMGTAALLQKVKSGDPAIVQAREVVRMATLGSARVLGIGDKVGSLEVGKQADLIFVDLDAPHMIPMYSPYSTLVYVATGSDVASTMVAGKFLMRERTLLTLDQRAIMDRALELSKKVHELLAAQSD